MILNHTKKVPLAGDVDLEVLGRGTPGFSGADLENLVNEAALLAARRDRDVVTMDDFESSKDKSAYGRRTDGSMIISDSEKRTTAYHEAGHALVALLPRNRSCTQGNHYSRGRALGVTRQLPSEDRLSMTKGIR